MNLYYFNPTEFYRNGIDWYPRVSPRLLVLLDTLRHQWSQPIHISPAEGALGRFAGSSESQHNVARWNEVRAVDVMPDGMRDSYDANDVFRLAVALGFTGVGVYPDWKPSPGIHLDVRQDRQPGDPATWGRVNNHLGRAITVSLNEALEAMG